MFLSSRVLASGFGLALAISFAIGEEPLGAQATSQDTAHKGMQMPKNMQMGKKTQEKKPAPKTTTAKKPATGKTATKTGKKSVPVGAATRKRVAPRKSQPVAMPMGAQPHHAPAKAGQMQMAESTHVIHADTAHHDTSGMKMDPARAKIDSMKMPEMPGMEMPSKMPSKPMDSAHTEMPGV